MQNVLENKGYYGSVEFDSRDEQLHGRLIGVSDVISYEGQSVEELKNDFQAAADDYLDTCREMGKEPEKPFSGRLMENTFFRLEADQYRHSPISRRFWFIEIRSLGWI